MFALLDIPLEYEDNYLLLVFVCKNLNLLIGIRFTMHSITILWLICFQRKGDPQHCPPDHVLVLIKTTLIPTRPRVLIGRLKFTPKRNC